MDDKSLNKLMAQLKAGNADALAGIYNAMARGVYTFIYPMLKDSSSAEDIVQNTFIQVYQKKEYYNEGMSARNWILTIAKNLTLNEIEKKKREIKVDFDDPVTSNSFAYTEEYNETPLLNLAKEILKENEYQVLYMHVVGDMKHKEIGEILNMPLGTVTWLYKEAIDKLKKEAVKRGGF